MRALLTTFGQMERDLTQVANPKFLGLTTSPVNVSIADGATMLQLARVAPASADRPTEVQTVYYRVVEGTLIRQATAGAAGVRSHAYRPPRNGAPARPGAADAGTDLVTERRLGRSEYPAGSPAARAAGEPARSSPGVEVTLERNDGQIFRRVLLVGA